MVCCVGLGREVYGCQCYQNLSPVVTDGGKRAQDPVNIRNTDKYFET